MGISFSQEDVTRAARKMVALAESKPFVPEAEAGAGLRVRVKDGQVWIAACDLNALYRGCFLAAEALKDGRTLDIEQRRHFEDVGAMVDMSRGGVWNVDSAKAFMDHMAALGMNMLQLYTEDVYEVPEYPYFGHMRGRYSQADLKELDDYAASLGIELIPCIQTLAHLGQFLQWSTGNPRRDQSTILMIDDDKTYDFIEAEIRAVRKCFRSPRIHIGMDEAHGVGLGEYFAEHGLTDRFELLNRHLGRVVAICKKYDFQPMMWSDMFFRLGSKTGDYYDLEADVPAEVIARIPDVQMVYWDYYNRAEAMYDAMMKGHQAMGKELVYAGGLWTWSGFLPQTKLTLSTMRPGLKQALIHGVKTVMATMWGDDGAETPFSLAESLLPLFSETCWQGKVPEDEELEDLGARVSGIPAAAFRAFGHFYASEKDNRNGKGLLYCDLLYPLMVNDERLEECVARLRKGEAELRPYEELADCAWVRSLMTLTAHKAEVILSIRDAYQRGDRAAMEPIIRQDIPNLLTELEELRVRYRAAWLKEFRRNGWEVLALRFGAVTDWVEGRAGTIAELEEESLPTRCRKQGMQFYQVYVTPSNGF